MSTYWRAGTNVTARGDKVRHKQGSIVLYCIVHVTQETKQGTETVLGSGFSSGHPGTISTNFFVFRFV